MYGGLKSLEAGDPINYSRVAALIFPFAWELIGHSKCPSRQSRIDEGDLDGGALARKKQNPLPAPEEAWESAPRQQRRVATLTDENMRRGARRGFWRAVLMVGEHRVAARRVSWSWGGSVRQV